MTSEAGPGLYNAVWLLMITLVLKLVLTVFTFGIKVPCIVVSSYVVCVWVSNESWRIMFGIFFKYQKEIIMELFKNIFGLSRYNVHAMVKIEIYCFA